MAEINSKQAAKLATRQKLSPNESHGRERLLYARTPDVYAAPAINDTLLLGRVPVNARFSSGAWVTCAAGTAAGTLNIGIRDARTGVVISATGIANGVAINAAGKLAADNGAYFAGGAEYVTDREVEVYATFTGAVGTANQAIKFEIPYVTD